MHRVNFAPLSHSVSAIGFGCASLGSRVDARRGLAALVRAYEAGVTWFDVAPSYGDGHAETLLGSFIAGKRSQVTLCTKVGILPGRVPFFMKVARPIGQRAVALLPGLRRHAVKFRPPAQAVELTGPFIESSLTNSMRRLKTDYVDVLALHEPRVADLQRNDVLRALDDVVTKGYARAISSAGTLSVSLQALNLSERVSIIQVANNLFHQNLALGRPQVPPGRPVHFVTHSVFGHNDSLDVLAATMEKDGSRRSLLYDVGYRDTPREAAAAFLLDFALASNPDGVVLLSMYQPRHLSSNLGRLSSRPPSGVVFDVGRQLMGEHNHPET